MIDWACQLGLRASELCAISLSQVPALDDAVRAERTGEILFIRLFETKGSVVSDLPISPQLVMMTWSYIKFERSVIINRNGYEGDKLFLSAGNGMPVKPAAFSMSVRRASESAKRAGDISPEARVWAHGLRHFFAQNLIDNLNSHGVKNSHEVARHLTRHRSLDGLDHYISISMKARHSQ